MRAKLKQSFFEQVPDTSDYQVGYFEKCHNRKHWIEDSDDLHCMYSSYQCSDTIKLWCDGHEEKSGGHTQKESGRKKTIDTTKEDDKKHKFESIVQELVDEHGDNYTEAQLRVWARLIVNGLYSSTSTPPNIPIITGEPAVKKRKIVQPEQDKSFTDILKNAVSVFAERFAPNPPLATGVSTSTTLGVSPASKAKLSSQHLGQLTVLQDLREKGVLSDDEFGEQKRFALNNIRRLNTNDKFKVLHGFPWL